MHTHSKRREEFGKETRDRRSRHRNQPIKVMTMLLSGTGENIRPYLEQGEKAVSADPITDLANQKRLKIKERDQSQTTQRRQFKLKFGRL